MAETAEMVVVQTGMIYHLYEELVVEVNGEMTRIVLRVELKVRAKVVKMGAKTSVVAKAGLQVVLKVGDGVEG